MDATTCEPTAPHSSRLHILRRALAAPLRYISTWYFAYMLLGMVTAGMVPVLLPLLVLSMSHRLGMIAYVMGAYNLGLFSSPLLGLLAERRHLYRSVFFLGFVISGVGIGTMPLLSGVSAWLPVAFLMGVGTSAAATVASLFVVDFAPQQEWEPRIGWLQCFNGLGQVFGLLLVGLFSKQHFSIGLWVAALLLAPALVLGGFGLPVPKAVHAAKGPARVPLHAHLDIRAIGVFMRANLGAGILRASHHLNLAALRSVPRLIGTPFGRFLVSWFVLCLGVGAFFAYFPVFLHAAYGIEPAVTSLVYAGSAAAGVVLFVVASHWAGRFGSTLVYQVGLFLRLIGFALLLVLSLVPLPAASLIAISGFALIILAWPLLSVSGTGLAAHLAPMSEGAAMGLFNAAGALATVIGISSSGPLVRALGYTVIPIMALVGLGLSSLLGIGLMGRQASPMPTTEG